MQINYHAHINQTGYSIAAQEYILAMRRVNPDVDIKLHFLNKEIGLGVSDNRKQLFMSMNKKQTKEPNLNVYHSIPHRYRRPPGKVQHVGFCVFETINPPSEWISMMNNMDLILTASEFNKHVFENNGVKTPISIVPHCFDAKMFNESVKVKGRYSPFTFISVGTWKKRKNWNQLIKGWYEAFYMKDNVCLLIKTDKPEELKAMTQTIKRSDEWKSKPTAPIYCEENTICDFEDIPSFLKKGDVYINASLGEGFGLGGIHAMALKIPVITTRFGGCLEYAKQDFCTYFEPDRYQRLPAMDYPQLSNCIWPHISVQEIATKLLSVAKDVKNREEKSEKAYSYVHENFCYEKIGLQLLELLGIK